MKFDKNNSVSTSPFILYTKSNLKSSQTTNNTRQVSQQKEPFGIMSNEETRCLTGVVAKTRALFESNTSNTFSTPQVTKSKINLKTFSSAQVCKPKTSISISIENESDKENTMHFRNTTEIKPILKNKDDFSKSKTTETNFSSIIKKSYSSNRISTCSDDFDQKPRGRLNSANIVINKSEEISKEFNIPLSVKQAKACFESLAQTSYPPKSIAPKFSTPSIGVLPKSRADGSRNTCTPIKAGNLRTETCKNIIVIPEMMNSLTSSSSSATSDSSVFNSSPGSSCETTPRLNEKKIPKRANKVADRIKKLEELKNLDENENNCNSIISSSSSACSNNQTSPNVKYLQSSKFIQLYQKQMEVNNPNTYRKLEDIINEADQNLVQKINVVHENKEEKKLKSILRKAPKFEPLVTSEIKIETKSTVRSPSCSSSSPSCSPSSSMSSLTTKQIELQKPEITQTKIDNSSCVVPSKIRQRTQSLDISNPQESGLSLSSNLTQMNNSFTSGVIKTPTRNVGSYIKNSSYSSAVSSNSGLVKRVTRSATNAREALTRWCRKMTEDYDNVSISNFSSSWSDGLAFCALIHHFMPNEFDYSKLSANNPRYNFELAFKTAEDKAGIVSLLDVDDMIEMGDSPDWKCVFTYVHSIYQRFKESC